jgi:hypothetical protein
MYDRHAELKIVDPKKIQINKSYKTPIKKPFDSAKIRKDVQLKEYLENGELKKIFNLKKRNSCTIRYS